MNEEMDGSKRWAINVRNWVSNVKSEKITL